MFTEALKIAYKAHNGQLRKQSFVPYIVHPFRVSRYFNDDVMKTIAILHDIVEDTNISLEYLSELFPSRVILALEHLTKRNNETHFEYIKRLKNNSDAVEVKIADIIDNLSDTIIVCPKSMADRYNKSLKMLIE